MKPFLYFFWRSLLPTQPGKHYRHIVRIGSLPLRVNGQFNRGRKAGSAHQYVLCFFRGNPDSIKHDFEEFA